MTALHHLLELLKLTLPFPLSTLHGLLGPFPDEAFVEFEEAPGLCGALCPPLQADQEERGQDRQRARACSPLFVVRALPLAQGQPALACLYGARAPQRQASILRIAPACASMRLVTLIFTCFGPALRRCFARTIVTAPSLGKGAWRVQPQ